MSRVKIELTTKQSNQNVERAARIAVEAAKTHSERHIFRNLGAFVELGLPFYYIDRVSVTLSDFIRVRVCTPDAFVVIVSSTSEWTFTAEGYESGSLLCSMQKRISEGRPNS